MLKPQKEDVTTLNAISLALFFGIIWITISIIIGSWQMINFIFIKFSNLFN